LREGRAKRPLTSGDTKEYVLSARPKTVGSAGERGCASEAVRGVGRSTVKVAPLFLPPLDAVSLPLCISTNALLLLLLLNRSIVKCRVSALVP
jgi:hypothetical protein